jgi:uncharacterized NAD(P)/FAD-binding protein YdhS
MGVIAAHELPSDPLDALRALTASEAELERLRRNAVRAARAAGATWDQIGDALGMTRQSAWEYFSRNTRANLARNAQRNTELGEDQAEQLAVDEAKAARRQRRAR